MKTDKKEWLKVTIKSDPVLVEPICDFLIGIIGAGVGTGAKGEDFYGTVTGYVEQADPDQETITNILATINTYLSELAPLFDVAVPTMTSAMIAEEDWGKNWKEHFKPFSIVPGLIISPTWEEYEPAPGEMMIEMDPGMAFGTGHHATTSLSLDFLREVLTSSDVKHQTVLDVGTGTGILGMAAVLFGADDVLGIDNDPDAVAAAKENAVRNGLQKNMGVSLAPLSTLEGNYSLVVANIIHNVLVAILADLTRLTVDGGILILSGILAGEQVESIISRFTEAGFSLRKKEVSGEWAALMLEKDVR